jgi:hypothetical protein
LASIAENTGTLASKSAGWDEFAMDDFLFAEWVSHAGVSAGARTMAFRWTFAKGRIPALSIAPAWRYSRPFHRDRMALSRLQSSELGG